MWKPQGGDGLRELIEMGGEGEGECCLNRNCPLVCEHFDFSVTGCYLVCEHLDFSVTGFYLVCEHLDFSVIDFSSCVPHPSQSFYTFS